MAAPLHDAPEQSKDDSFEEARWRHYQTQPAAPSLPAAGAPQIGEGSHGASGSSPAQDGKLCGWVGGELAAADCAAQLDTIAEVTDEVPDTAASSVQRAAPPTAVRRMPASAQDMTPQRTAAASVHQSNAPGRASQNSSVEEPVISSTCPQSMNNSMQPAAALAPQPSGQQSASATAEVSQPVLPPAAGPDMQSAAVADDDVTLATAAAFAEMNDMFSSALTHDTAAQLVSPEAPPPSPAEPHGEACTRRASPVLGDEENARPEASTGRACLAPYGNPPRRLQPARSAPAPMHRSSVVAGNAVMTLGGATAVTCNTSPAAESPCGGMATDDTRPVPIAGYQVAQSAPSEAQGPAGVFQGSSPVSDAKYRSLDAVYREPTVTIATREAFAALNGMFAAQLPHDRVARPAIPPIPRPPARQAPRGSIGGGGRSQSSPGGCSRSGAALPEDTRELPVYEDTQFLLAPANSPAAGVRLPAAAQDTTQPLFLDAAPAAERTASLPVYEDTQLLARGPGLDRTATLAVYENTALVPQSRSSPAARPSPRAAAAAAGSADATAPLQFYEDTQFLTRALPPRSDGRAVTPFAAAGADPVRTPATEVQQVCCGR